MTNVSLHSQLKNAEAVFLSSLLKERRPEDAGSVIYQVIQQRHLRETVELEAQHGRERKLATEEKKSAIKNKRQEKRDTVVADQEKEILQLISKSASLMKPELAKQKTQMKKEHRKQLAEFDRKTQALLEAVNREVSSEMDVHHQEKLLSLRERQIREIANTMEEISPEQALIQSYKYEARHAAEEAERYRKEVVEARERRLNDLKEEKRRREEERRKEREQQVRELEAEISRERQRDSQRQEQLKERYEVLQQRRLAEQEELHQKTLRGMGNIPEGEREVRRERLVLY